MNVGQSCACMHHFLILILGTPNRVRGILQDPVWTCPSVFNSFNLKMLQHRKVVVKDGGGGKILKSISKLCRSMMRVWELGKIQDFRKGGGVQIDLKD